MRVRGAGWNAVVVAVALSACWGPRAPSRIIRFHSTAYSTQLRNGLRVQVVEDHATNLVQLGVRLDVGSASDPPGKAGLAHLVEHLMFQIGGSPGGRPVGAELSAIAIGFNARTTWEATQYVSVARADQVERLVALEARRFSARCDTIAPGTFEREREVVRNELRLRRGALGDDLERLMQQIVPRGHPYARSVGGSDLELSRLTLADVCEFLAAHYQPDRMIVVLSGDIAARPAIGVVARHLGALRGRSTAAKPFFPAIAAAQRVFRGDLHLGTGPAVLVAWPIPVDYGRDRAAASIATLLLHAELGRAGGTMVELGETRAPVAAALIKLPGAGVPTRAAIDRALVAVKQASARAATERSRAVLQALANRRARELLADFDRLPSRVERLAEGLQRGARDHVFTLQLQALDLVRPQDVSRVAGRLFASERQVVVAIEPGARRPSDGPEHSYAGKSHDDAWTASVDPREATEVLRVPLPRSILAQAQSFRLANGLEIILLRTPAAPLVSARIVFAGGSADDPPGKQGLAALAARSLEFRTLKPFGPSGAPAYRALAWFGDLDVQVDADRTMFSAIGLSSHLDVVVAGLASLVEGTYGDGVQDRLRAARFVPARSDATAWDDRRARLRRSLYRSVYGASHPYARAADPRHAGSHISRADLERVRGRRFGGRNGVLIITGDFDPSLAREHAEHWFSDLRPGEREVVVRPPPARRRARAVVALPGDPADGTAIIEIAYPTRKQPERRAARMVMGRILRERMARVREVLGAAYSINAVHEDNIGPGMFLISAAVDAHRADEALSTMLGELARLRAGEGADLAESFVRARREVLYGLLAEESGADSAGARVAALLQQGESLRADANLAREIMRLTIADLRPILATDLAPEQECIGIMGPEVSIAAARSAAGI